MTQTLSPRDTGEIQLTEDPTRDLTRLRNGPHPSPLPRADLADTVTLVEPMIGGFERATHPDTMPVPPRPPQKFQPDTTGSPQPYPAPVPAGPKPRQAKVLVPLLRPAAPLGELYADQRARRGLPPLRAPKGYIGRHRRAGAR